MSQESPCILLQFVFARLGATLSMLPLPLLTIVSILRGSQPQAVYCNFSYELYELGIRFGVGNEVLHSIPSSGETLLHVCARLGSANCINRLARTLGSTLGSKDQYGLIPLQVTKWCWLKATVDALGIHGANASCSQHLQCKRLRKIHWHKWLTCALNSASCTDLGARLADSEVPICVRTLQ